MRKVKVEDAVGLMAAHDMTEVNVEKNIKRVAFRRRTIIRKEDIEKLKALGREHVFVFDDHENEVHEDEAALELAPLLAGENIFFDSEPREGKISFYAGVSGLLKIDVDRVIAVNRLQVPSLPTLHNNLEVEKGRQVAAFRIIPLTCKRKIVDQCRAILAGGQAVLSVKPFVFRRAALIVTGNEVWSGRIEDRFTGIMEKKLAAFGVELVERTVLPDDREIIRQTLVEFARTAELVILTGGTSVDPDDATRAAMRAAGVELLQEGNPLQPGNNFTIGYLAGKPVCAVPAAALFFPVTAFDIFLPRFLADDPVITEELAVMAVGGLCHFCKVCRYPVCPFGK